MKHVRSPLSDRTQKPTASSDRFIQTALGEKDLRRRIRALAEGKASTELVADLLGEPEAEHRLRSAQGAPVFFPVRTRERCRRAGGAASYSCASPRVRRRSCFSTGSRRKRPWEIACAGCQSFPRSLSYQPSNQRTSSGVSVIRMAERLSSSSATVRGPMSGITGYGWAMT